MRDRLRRTWRRVLSLSWPVITEQVLRTAMRTTDVFVTGAFSPAAVAAVGLADLYARFPLRVGLGLGGGAIALSSQDTGRGDAATRDEAVTQAVLVGAVTGIPFAVGGVLFGDTALALLGAPPNVATMGGTYLAVVFATAPARHVALIAARSMQGTGDTRTPMYVNVVANAYNIGASVALGFGVGAAPALGVLGVGLATASANVLTAGALVAALAGPWTAASFVRPRSPVVARQLLAVSAPRVAEGFTQTAAEFPFNALLLALGTEVNAAFQIGRRIYQQVTGPLSRGYNVAASVVVGQALGGDGADTARFEGWAVAGLGVLTVGGVGAALVVAAPALAGLFTADATTAAYAAGFTRTYGATAAFLACFTVLSGALQGASETRVPLVARLSGNVLFLLGLSYLLAVPLGLGVLGVYVGLGTSYVWMAAVVAYGFHWGGWAGRAAAMMAERG